VVSGAYDVGIKSDDRDNAEAGVTAIAATTGTAKSAFLKLMR